MTWWPQYHSQVWWHECNPSTWCRRKIGKTSLGYMKPCLKTLENEKGGGNPIKIKPQKVIKNQQQQQNNSAANWEGIQVETSQQKRQSWQRACDMLTHCSVAPVWGDAVQTHLRGRHGGREGETVWTSVGKNLEKLEPDCPCRCREFSYKRSTDSSYSACSAAVHGAHTAQSFKQKRNYLAYLHNRVLFSLQRKISPHSDVIEAWSQKRQPSVGSTYVSV